MSKRRRDSAVAAWFLGVTLLAGLAAWPRLAPAEPPGVATKATVVTRSLPATSGVRSEARTVLDAPADTVASLVSDPRNFAPLFPAHAVEVLESTAELKVVAVEMRKPWPVGTVKWVEDVVQSRDEDGKAFIVSRRARPGYFKQMSARWHIAPDPSAQSARCIVTYEVAMELARWAPEWALRRGNLNGMLDTMSRLRNLVAEAGKQRQAGGGAE